MIKNIYIINQRFIYKTVNKNCFKLIFSCHLNSVVAVGENVCAKSKAASTCESSFVLSKLKVAITSVFNPALKALLISVFGQFLFYEISFAQVKSSLPSITASALPTGSQVASGSVATSVKDSTLTINQTSNKAIVNWNSFEIGSAAKVNIIQPSSQALLLNRVVGQNMTQIHGQMSANGQVMLVNPNGVVVGKDGSVSASGFTASSYGIADADFLNERYKFDRNGVTTWVRNDGKIQTTSGGYVALIGAEVVNGGQIYAPQGHVLMVAGESVTLPSSVIQTPQLASTTDATAPNAGNLKVPLSQRVHLSVSAAAINTAVTNTADGVIVTEGGQVLLQAAALTDSVASVMHLGRIDTSADQGGNVMILADHGEIQVHGIIKADSTNQLGGQASSGGRVYIGRDPDTNVLAARTDVSNANIQSGLGFVETSGELLKADNIQVRAKEWSIDPTDVEINQTSVANVSGASVILASDINAALNAGTNVTISTGVSGSGSSAVGVTQSIAGTGNTAVGSISVNENILKSSGAATSLTLTANKDITFAPNKTIGSTSGSLDVVLNSSAGIAGGAVVLNAGSGIITNGGNVTVTTDSYFGSGTSEVINAGLGTVTIQNKTVGTLVNIGGVDVTTGSPLTLGLSNAELNRISAANLKIGNTTSGSLTVSSTTTLGASTGNLYLLTNSSLTINNALSSGAGLFLQTTGGSISSTAALTGVNISLDNTNGTINATTGFISAGTGSKGASDAIPAISLSADVNASGNIHIQGNSSSSSKVGVQLNTGALLSTSKISGLVNISSNQSILNNGGIRAVGQSGLGSNINLTSVNDSISGSGSIGDLTNNNASVTITQAANSTYHGAINAMNFTKADLGQLTLDSWIATSPVSTKISNAYTVTGGGVLTLSTGSGYPVMNPVSVNVENASTFVTSATSTGYWGGTTFNFTGGAGGGVMYLLGNPVAQGLQFSPTVYSTSGGATNAVIGGININSANVNLNLTTASRGVQLADGSFAALAFLRNDQGGDGMHSAGIVTMNGGGNLLIDDRIIATKLNINSGSIQVGDGNPATASSTPVLNVGTIDIASSAKLSFFRAESNTNNSIITGTGMLVQAGPGKLTLTANSSDFAGSTIVNAGASLELGTGASLGTTGSTLSLVDGMSSLILAETSGTSTIGSNISGLGSVRHSGAGTGVLTGTNTYSGVTTISAGTLQVGNGGSLGTLGSGDVSLSNMSNLIYSRSATTTVSNNISGTGHVSAIITDSGSDLTVNHTINLTAGTINLVTDGNLNINQLIRTTNATTSAIFLNAGKSVSAGDASGGNVVFSGNGAVMADNGRITIGTGSITSSTGVNPALGHSRYNSDETTTQYSAALDPVGMYVIYREMPYLTIKVEDVVKTYDGQSFFGGSLNRTLMAGVLVNGDSFDAASANVVFGGAAQGAVNLSSGAPYVISAQELTGVNALGYGITYLPGSLTVNSSSQSNSSTQTTEINNNSQMKPDTSSRSTQQTSGVVIRPIENADLNSSLLNKGKIPSQGEFKVRPMILNFESTKIRQLVDTFFLTSNNPLNLDESSDEEKAIITCSPVMIAAVVCNQDNLIDDSVN